MPRILICNEIPEETEALITALTSQGYQVDIAETIKQTLHEVAFENYHALIFGMNMDTAKGIEAISMINRIDVDLPIVTITGQDSVENQIKARREKIFYYLVRPIDHEEIVKVLDKALLQKKRR